MNKIDLNKIFEAMNEEVYCVIKPDYALPDYKIGSDIDIFCLSKERVLRLVLKCLDDVLTDDTKIVVNEFPSQAYIDVMDKGEIHFRFDLYSELPTYRNISLKPSLFESILLSRVKSTNVNLMFYVPSLLDDMILRYVEYNEWFAERADKIKHVDYINAQINDDKELRKEMLDKLHHYVSLPEVKYEYIRKSKIMTYFENIKYVFEKLILVYKRDGFKVLLKKIIRRIR